MNLLETVRISLHAILANRLRSFLTILGIVIGVVSVIVLVSIVSGLKTYITSQIEGLGSNLIFVIPGRIGGARTPGGIQANKLTLQDSNILKDKLLGEARVSAVVQRGATLKLGNKKDERVSVFGVEGEYFSIISVKLTQGRRFTNQEADSSKKVAVIGYSVKEKLFGEKDPVGGRIDVAGIKYQVIGVAEKRGSIFGIDQDNSILVPLPSAQRQFGLDKLNTVYISAKGAADVKDIQTKVHNIMKKRLSEDEFTVQTQEQALSTISQITGVLTLALGGIAAISLLVGGIGIMNIMLVTVTERTREIGLRKALGARNKDIRNQFLTEALTLSGVGGVIGIVLGVLLSIAIGIFFQTTVTLWSIALSFGFSILVGVIFGVAPAIKASKLDPIQALRYD